MTIFEKESWDVAQIFLAYLAFHGNSTRVAIALKIPAEVVEVLAEKENWAGKLKTYVGLRNPKRLSETDGKIRRTVTHILACQLRDVIQKVINHAHEKVDADDLVDLLSVRCRRTGRPKISIKTLWDLTRAYQLATRVIDREITLEENASKRRRSEKQRLSFQDAITRAMQAADSLRGVDSVALVNKSLSKWPSGDAAR